MTYRHGAEGTGGAGADAVELLWASPGVDSPAPEPDSEMLTATAALPPEQPEPEPAPEAEPAAEAWSASDEWEDLRQVLAGDDTPPPAEDDDEDDDEDEVDEVVAFDDEDEDERADDDTAGALAALVERVEQLASELDEERAERVRLEGQLDRLATELDAVLGEALATEQQRREQIEEALRHVQATLSETEPGPYDGPERRTSADRRVSVDRRRTGARRERPLRARDFTPEPVDEEPTGTVEAASDFDVEAEVESPSVWKSRLNEVAGSVSSWSADDIDRLRVD